MISTTCVGRVASSAAPVDPADVSADPWASLVLAKLLPVLDHARVLARLDRSVVER